MDQRSQPFKRRPSSVQENGAQQLDGAKALYPDILSLVEDRLRPGALIVADNADFCPEYLAHVRSPENGYLSVPFSDDVELSMRIK